MVGRSWRACGCAVWALAASVFGEVAGTATWTGGAGDGKWSSNANWTFTDAQGASLAFAAADWKEKTMNLDFSRLPSGACVTCDVAEVKGLGRVTFPATAGGEWTLVGTAASNVKLRNEATTLVLPEGTTLRWGLRHPCDWGDDKPFTITGGGAFVLDTEHVMDFYRQDLLLDDSTFICRRMKRYNTLSMAGITLKGDRARVVFEGENTLGYVQTADATPGAQVFDIGTNQVKLMTGASQTATGAFTGRLVGSGTFILSGGCRPVFTTSADFTGTLLFDHGDLLAEAPFARAVRLEQRLGGRLRLGCDQTLAALVSKPYTHAINGLWRDPEHLCPLGGVDVAAGCTLTAAGPAAGAQADVFCGALAGGGSFAKDGAAYTLTLKGASRYAGATHVRAGTLSLVSEQTAEERGRALPPGAVVYLDFEDAADFGANRAGTALTLKANAAAASAACPGAVGQGIRLAKATNFAAGAGGIPAGLLPGPEDDFTLSLWLRPDPSIAEAPSWYSSFRHGTWNGSKGESLRWISFGSDTSTSYFGLRTISYPGADATGQENRWYCFAETPETTRALLGVWHHYAMVSRHVTRADGQRARRVSLYLDGALVKEDETATCVPAALPDDLCIGEAYVGDMDEFVYAKGAWTPEQVAAEYARTAAAPGEARDPAADLPAPVAHWAFEDPDDIGKDSSGNGYHLTTMGNAEKVVLEANRPGAYGGHALVLNADAGAQKGFANGGGGAASTRYGALTLKDDAFPAKIPTGAKPFTVAIRYQMPYETGYTVFYWGGRALATNGYFRVKDGNQPHLSKGDFSQFSHVKDNFHNATLATTVLMGGTVSDATWLTVVYVYTPDDHIVRAYVDGVLDEARSAAVTMPDGMTSYPNLLGEALYVGYCPDGGYNYAGVAIDDLRVYDAALSADQVKTLVQALATGEVGPTLPRGTDVTVAAGARLEVAGAGHVFGALAGAGTVDVAPRARLAVTNDCTFAGALAGYGAVRAEAGATVALAAANADFRGFYEARDGGTLVLAGDAARACVRVLSNGRVVGAALAAPAALDDGLVLTADAARLPAVKTAGTVTIPASGRLAFATPPARSATYVLAEGGALALPDDFSGWTTAAPAGRAYTVTFTTNAEKTKFLAKVACSGLAVIVR